MSSTSMTGGAAEPSASILWKFIVFWPFSLVVPWILLTAVRAAIFAIGPEEVAYQAAVLLPILSWLLIAYLQFRLLRPHLRRGRLWLIATFVGGNLGGFIGGLAQIWMAPMVEGFVIGGENMPEWLFLYHPAVSIVAAVPIGTALLGFLQSFCLDDTLGRRLLWPFASVVAGFVGALFGYACYFAYGRFMFEFYPEFVFGGGLISIVITISVGTIGGMIVYGLLTGIVLRWLLLRGARRQKEALIARFE